MLTLNEFEEMVTQREFIPDWIKEILPQTHDPMLIVGRPGIGKTMLVLNLAFALATGSKFLGFPCRKTVVGCLFFEGSESKLLERIAKIRKNYPDPGDNLRLEVVTPFKLGRKPKEFAEKVQGCRIVVLDPLRYIVSGDYCKPQDAATFLETLKSLAVANNFTPVLCAHVRKRNPNSLLEPGDLFELKGAGDYAEVANSVLMLERARQGHNPSGNFAPVSKDNLMLYFPKTRDAIGDMEPMRLHFNRDCLTFDCT